MFKTINVVIICLLSTGCIGIAGSINGSTEQRVFDDGTIGRYAHCMKLEHCEEKIFKYCKSTKYSGLTTNSTGVEGAIVVNFKCGEGHTIYFRGRSNQKNPDGSPKVSYERAESVNSNAQYDAELMRSSKKFGESMSEALVPSTNKLKSIDTPNNSNIGTSQNNKNKCPNIDPKPHCSHSCFPKELPFPACGIDESS